jgi:hypothetical protein
VAGRRHPKLHLSTRSLASLTIGSPVFPQDLVIIQGIQEEFMGGQVSEEISLIHSGAWEAGGLWGILEWNSLLDWTFPEETPTPLTPGQYPGSFHGQYRPYGCSSLGPLDYEAESPGLPAELRM